MRQPVVAWGQNLQRTSNSTMASPLGLSEDEAAFFLRRSGQRREPPSSGRTAKPAIKPMHWAAYRVSDKSVAIVVAVFQETCGGKSACDLSANPLPRFNDLGRLGKSTNPSDAN